MASGSGILRASCTCTGSVVPPGGAPSAVQIMVSGIASALLVPPVSGSAHAAVSAASLRY